MLAIHLSITLLTGLDFGNIYFCACWIFWINMILIHLSVLFWRVTGSWWICNGRRVWCTCFGRTWACKGFFHAIPLRVHCLDVLADIVQMLRTSNLDFCRKEVHKYMLNFWEEASHVMHTTWQSLIPKVYFSLILWCICLPFSYYPHLVLLILILCPCKYNIRERGYSLYWKRISRFRSNKGRH